MNKKSSKHDWLHPDAPLCKAFARRPFQGCEPGKAKVIFIGLDANFPEPMTDRFHTEVLNYLRNPRGFWARHQMHHPFLLADYPGDKRKGGRRYHIGFAGLGLTKHEYEDVCFLEAFPLPTCRQADNDSLRKYALSEPGKGCLEGHRRVLKGALLSRGVVLISPAARKRLRALGQVMGDIVVELVEKSKDFPHFSSTKYFKDCKKYRAEFRKHLASLNARKHR